VKYVFGFRILTQFRKRCT